MLTLTSSKTGSAPGRPLPMHVTGVDRGGAMAVRRATLQDAGRLRAMHRTSLE